MRVSNPEKPHGARLSFKDALFGKKTLRPKFVRRRRFSPHPQPCRPIPRNSIELRTVGESETFAYPAVSASWMLAVQRDVPRERVKFC